ncbi:hypothetical protein BH24ACT5_BH24ACT5_26660 [soil metagenome]
MSEERYLPISDYAFLTDCHSTALVSRHGSIDWACLRRFDAGSTFGRILDADRGGCFSIRPVGEIVSVERAYVPATMVLTTTLGTDAGSIRCTDAFAMAPGGAANVGGELLRLIELVDVDIVIEPRFDYGLTRPWLRRHEDGRSSAVGGDDALIIHTTTDLEIDRDACRLRARVHMDDDAQHSFSVVARPAHLVDTAAAECATVRDRLDETRSGGWTSPAAPPPGAVTTTSCCSVRPWCSKASRVLRPAPSWLPPPRRCPRCRVGPRTGTTATAGSAIPPSRSAPWPPSVTTKWPRASGIS